MNKTTMEFESLKKRIDFLIDLADEAITGESFPKQMEVYNGTITLLSGIHGPDSHHVSVLLSTHKKVGGANHITLLRSAQELTWSAQGALENLKAEIESGLMGSLQKRMTSEVLTDTVQLARTVLDEAGDNAKKCGCCLICRCV